MTRVLLALVIVTLAGLVAVADELPGHSDHGEAFNEGPRQAAYLMGGTGNVHFEVTTKNPLAQKFFDQGVGQLHGFWYFEAERTFRQVAAIDKECAMAYWGMAQANVNNNKRAKGFIAEAVKRKGGASKREQAHIDALNVYITASDTKDKEKLRQRSVAYVAALDRIATDNPADIETKAMIALKMWQDNKEMPIASYAATSALLEEVFAASPMHPAHHYRIHLWNSRRDELALESAARCGQTSPGIAHMWHMPGHTYSKLRRYDDAAWQQEASARVDHAHMMRDRVLPDQIHNFAHNNEWLIRDLCHVGRVGDALDLARNMIELPQHPAYNTLDGKKRGSAYYGRVRLLGVMEQYELFDQIIAASKTASLPPTDSAVEQARLTRSLGLAYYRTGKVGAGDKQLAALEERLAKLPPPPPPAPEAKKGAKQESKKAAEPVSEYNKPEPPIRDQLKRSIDELRAWKLAAEGDYVAAADAYAKLSAKDADRSQLARLQSLAGRGEEAVKTAQAYYNGHKNEVQPLANLVDVLHRSGKGEEAQKMFAELRRLSGTIDLRAGSPVFARLGPVAESLGLPSDWRTAHQPAKDVGQRPPLDSLGPFRWQPLPAPMWTLKDAAGKSVTLAEYRGRPVIVIFYLGHGCVHCVQQVRAFTPMATAFKDAGIELLAISTDTAEDLHKSLEETAGEFPIRLVSDAGLSVFRAYRAFDDFEGKPLHGTFLVDPSGLVRWQDISYEPFMNARFLLNESKRLLEK